MSLDEKKATWMQEAIDLIDRLLPLGHWHFKETARYFGNGIHPTLIYDSNVCRIRVVFTATDRPMDRGFMIDYGKLEVPYAATILVRGAQENDYARLWHSVNYALYFLDGLSAQQAKNTRVPRFVDAFRQSDTSKTIGYQPERDLTLHALIWETYGDRLFRIFENQNDELWKHYSAFIAEFWRVIPQV